MSMAATGAATKVSSAPTVVAQPTERVFPVHLAAGSIAATVFCVALFMMSLWSDWLVARHIYPLASSRHRQKDVGLAVQREAFRHDDLLPFYGTSEVDRVALYHARDLFADAPTGFSTLTVGRPGGLVFSAVQSLGALGRDIHGKKVVVSLSPTMFQLEDGPRLAERYAGNLYPLQALALLLNRDLSVPLRQEVARRLLARRPMIAAHKTIEALAVVTAARGAFASLAYSAVVPLARLQLALLEAQDKLWELGYVLTTRLPSIDGRPRLRQLDWPALAEDATRQYRPSAQHNEFGLDDLWWEGFRVLDIAQRNASSDARFLRTLDAADAWIDLEQLLQILKELDARALILSMPFHGPFMDYTGVSAAARSRYYERVREMAARHGVREVVLDDHDSDPYFFRDLGSHPSPKGWVIYDQILDAFYHDHLR